MQGETRVSPVLISSHKISKKPYVQSLQKKLGVNQPQTPLTIQPMQSIIEKTHYQKVET